jgi:A/G-specific adenine glycosylase
MMLQQTRVEQALPYYRRFIRRFPSVRALAEADRDEVLKYWQGLGYYARARNMHKAAVQLHGNHRGRFPRSIAGLLALPGIGEYSAAAIGSLAMGLDVPVLDGNVRRVLSRVFCLAEPVDSSRGKRVLQDYAQRLVVAGRMAAVNEALMELGALCCLPRKPLCGSCPLRGVCRAAAQQRAEEFPKRSPRTKRPHKHVGAGIIVRSNGDILLAQRKDTAMLGGLWEFPGGSREPGEAMPECIRRELKEELGLDTAVGDCLIVVKHEFSHFTMDLHAHWVRIRRGRPRVIDCAGFAWVAPEQLHRYAMPKADVVILERLRKLWREEGPRMHIKRSQ